MTAIDEALNIVRGNPELAAFAGPRATTLVAQAEDALGGSFPPTYRRFIDEFGAGNFGAFEVYGVVDDNFADGSVPNGVWLTLDEQSRGTIAHGIMLIGSTGDGGYYSLELNGGDGPISIVWPGSAVRQVAANDFGSFLLEGVEREL